MLTIWNQVKLTKRVTRLEVSRLIFTTADANTRADTYKPSFNPKNGLDARARMCKSALEDIYFNLFSFSYEMTKFALP